MPPKDRQHVEQEVPEVAGVESLQALLVRRVELGAAPGSEGFELAGIDLRWSPAAVLPAVDQAGELPRGPALLVEVRRRISCLSTRSWSSVSRIVKLEWSPTSSAWLRSIRAATEWNVPSHGMPSIVPPEMARDARLHLARGLVGEGDGENWLGHALRLAMRWASRAVSAAVLPVPAPASTSTGPSVVSTASRCGGFRRSR